MESDNDEFLWLERPIHKNTLPKDFFEKNEHLVNDVRLSFDGSIMSVRRSRVERQYLEQNVEMIRLGYKEVPKGLKVVDEESFYKMLSFFVELE